MKKILAVLGSSRAGSASRLAAEAVLEAAAGNGYEISRYYPGTMEMKGCLGCGCCKQRFTDCLINDDLSEYFRELHGCNALLLAAPNYYGQPAGHMITFLNRHFCLTGPDRKSRLQRRIKLVGIFAQKKPPGEPAYEESYDRYLQEYIDLGMEPAGRIVIGRNSDLQPGGEILRRAAEIGAGL